MKFHIWYGVNILLWRVTEVFVHKFAQPFITSRGATLDFFLGFPSPRVVSIISQRQRVLLLQTFDLHPRNCPTISDNTLIRSEKLRPQYFDIDKQRCCRASLSLYLISVE